MLFYPNEHHYCEHLFLMQIVTNEAQSVAKQALIITQQPALQKL